ncbi:hypothetical protein ACLB2K_065852 [Fragaria x ananassa]
MRRARYRKKENLELQTWSELPIELLEVISSRLSLDDNIRASAVCKRWHSAAVSVRRRFHTVDFPQLNGSRVCYTKGGWLLLYRPRTLRVFFFNPFTQEVVKLPRFELAYQIFAFSAPPTSTSCIVFTIKHVNPTVVAISTCHPRAQVWTTVQYQNRLPFVSSIWNKLVFCNDLFYCQSLTGYWVGVFNPQERTWSVLSVPPPKCPKKFFAKNWWKGKFMTEKDGDILVVYTCSTENPIAFKLDQGNMVWEEIKNLDGVTVFASFLTTYANTNLPAIKRNSIYFSKICYYGRQCISYSLEDGRYHPRNECHDWGEQDPFKTIWIDPPEGFARFD